ncbi:MAG: hypothetical protein DLM61_16700 [Pseudonocardiales bacterium]|nr:hypothetical protein [Pseudonocardiales bacterium]PZS27410.1 MAG: hypothetical protein DLM61_16700 [Pseudonocardiales bacterium]
MSTQIEDHRRAANARDGRDPWSSHVAVDMTTEPVAADPTTQRVEDSMVQLVRQGQDTSLRSLQVWADLARKLGPTALSSPAGATMASLAHDPFEKLLEAQRQVVEELVATQRQLAQRLFDTTATGGLATP